MLTRRFTVADENIRVGPGGPVGFLMSDKSQPACKITSGPSVPVGFFKLR